jgi:hypothetical protein
MSITGPNIFVPNGPLIPSDSLTSKSKIDGMTYPVTKLILSQYATTTAVVAPVAGMLIFNTSTGKLNFYDGTGWQIVTSA